MADEPADQIGGKHAVGRERQRGPGEAGEGIGDEDRADEDAEHREAAEVERRGPADEPAHRAEAGGARAAIGGQAWWTVRGHRRGQARGGKRGAVAVRRGLSMKCFLKEPFTATTTTTLPVQSLPCQPYWSSSR